MRKNFNKVLGSRGEMVAASYLKKQGYTILLVNYTTKIGEIDIIASKGKRIIFVEVKTRNTMEFGRPSEAVNLHKQNKIRKVAELFFLENKLQDVECQFDVIEIIGDKINHIENAF